MSRVTYSLSDVKDKVKKAKAPFIEMLKNSIVIKDASLARKVKRLAHQSHTKPCDWAYDVLDLYIREHRSNKPPVDDPMRHTERPGVDERELYEDCFVGDEEGL